MGGPKRSKEALKGLVGCVAHKSNHFTISSLPVESVWDHHAAPCERPRMLLSARARSAEMRLLSIGDARPGKGQRKRSYYSAKPSVCLALPFLSSLSPFVRLAKGGVVKRSAEGTEARLESGQTTTPAARPGSSCTVMLREPALSIPFTRTANPLRGCGCGCVCAVHVHRYNPRVIHDQRRSTPPTSSLSSALCSKQ